MFSGELFWLILSFIALIAVSYKFMKKAISSNLDGYISLIENDMLNAIQARIDAKMALESLNSEYASALQQTKNIVDDARIEANKIIQDAQNKVLCIAQNYEQLIKEDKIKAETDLIKKFKHDVLLAAVSAVEKEISCLMPVDEQNTLLQGKARALKKIWH